MRTRVSLWTLWRDIEPRQGLYPQTALQEMVLMLAPFLRLHVVVDLYTCL